MELTDKETEFLKVIREAEERGYPVTFKYGDEEKVNEYLQLYGDVYNSLKLAFVFTGAITCGSILNVTEKGKVCLEKALLKKEKEMERKDREKSDRKNFKRELIIAVVCAIIGSFVTWILMKFL